MKQKRVEIKQGSKTNVVFDVLKFVLALAVVSIHTGALSSVSPLMNRVFCHGLARLAVPLSFMMSGYFLYRKPLTKENLKKYCIRLLKFYLFYFVLFFPRIFQLRYLNSSSDLPWLSFITAILFASSFQGSWYINASILAPIALYLGKNKKKIMVAIAIVAYVFCTLASSYHLFDDMIWYWKYEMIFHQPFNTFLIAMPYFILAKYISSTENTKLMFYKKRYVLSIVCLILLVAEIVMCHYSFKSATPDCYFMLLPTAYFLFITICNMKKKIKIKESTSLFLRKCSTLIYVWHFIVLWIVRGAYKKIFGADMNSILLFVVVAIGAMLISALIIKLSEKIKFLKNAY